MWWFYIHEVLSLFCLKSKHQLGAVFLRKKAAAHGVSPVPRYISTFCLPVRAGLVPQNSYAESPLNFINRSSFTDGDNDNATQHPPGLVWAGLETMKVHVHVCPAPLNAHPCPGVAPTISLALRRDYGSKRWTACKWRAFATWDGHLIRYTTS